MEKLKFETVGQFLVALEEGHLFNEEGLMYVLNEDEGCLEISRSGKLVQKEYSLSGIWHSSINYDKHKRFTRQKPIPDKALVWCWDNGDNFTKTVRFYDGENNRTFSPSSGKRNFSWFENYEVIEPNEQGVYEEPFAWANEAVKKLED